MKANKTFKLIVVRHGNTFEANQIATQVGCKTDLPLTEKGLSQAQAFSTMLKDKNVNPLAIYCGSLQRQSKTAHIIQADFTKAKLYSQTQALDEIDYGAWEGLTTDEIKANWSDEYEKWVSQSHWPSSIFQSSIEHHFQALNRWLAEVAANAPENGTVVAVSSNGIIRFMLHWIPTLWDSLVNEQKMESYKVGTGNYCEFVFEGNEIPRIEAWNVKP